MYVLIVDDHDLFRQGLAQSLLECTQVSAVSEANSVDTARKLLQEKHHMLELVILDHSLPDGDGVSLLAEVQQDYPLLPVAMLSAHEDHALMRQSLDAGAQGFIPKSTSTSVLLSAIGLILSGGIYIPPSLYQAAEQPESTASPAVLTRRQDEVLKLIRAGLSNKEIAWQLDISEATVKAHVTVILRAYGVSSRTRLLASEQG